METLIYEKLSDKAVRCGICRHACVIQEGKRGRCHVRENQDGRLLSLVYPRLIAKSIDPIEKKPIFHLKPGSFSYSIATVGCNFKCVFCQNSEIAQMPADSGMIQGADTAPEKIVEEALKAGCESISYTYTEPTVFFELALHTARLAKEKGLYNIFVTNGYMSPQALEMISPWLDAANVDLKAFTEEFYRTYCKARLEPVKENIRHMLDLGIFVELTTLLIPGLNDDPKELTAMAEYIARDLGPETPWHISRFHPCYRLTDRPSTPVSSLMTAFEAGQNAGLYYVYTGNAPGLASENTFCRSCKALLVKRQGYRVENRLLPGGACPECKTPVHGIY
nr:AmmeMemoRadiSam system radical SAM enzyme [Desulfobacula sp.]